MAVDNDTRSYHHGDLRRALLDATRDLLVEGGIEAATLRAVARRAGVSNRAPYHHFADKCCLLAAVATEAFENLCRGFDLALDESGQDPAQRLEALLLSYLDFANHHPGEFQVMFWHEVCDPEEFEERGEKASEAFRYLLGAIESLAREPIDPEELLSLAVSAWSAVHGFATLRAQGAFREAAQIGSGARPDAMPRLAAERLASELCSRAASRLAAEIGSPLTIR